LNNQTLLTTTNGTRRIKGGTRNNKGKFYGAVQKVAAWGKSLSCPMKIWAHFHLGLYGAVSYHAPSSLFFLSNKIKTLKKYNLNFVLFIIIITNNQNK
jgi:hypothetical protein